MVSDRTRSIICASSADIRASLLTPLWMTVPCGPWTSTSPFLNRLPVGPVLVVDLVEGYLVVDVPDVLESLGQFNVAIGEVEIQFRELADLAFSMSPSVLACRAAATAASVSFRVDLTPSISLVASNSSDMAW